MSSETLLDNVADMRIHNEEENESNHAKCLGKGKEVHAVILHNTDCLVNTDCLSYRTIL